MAGNSLFPLLLYLLFSLLPSPSLSLSISPPSTNATYGYSSLSFPSFNTSLGNTTLTLFGHSSISVSGALQITPDSLNNPDYLVNKSGRIFLPKPFPFWENTSSGVHLASFSTAFEINIFRNTNVSKPGEGFAFLIASSLEGPPPGSENGYLGLTNYTLNGNLSNKFVAVELDTVQQSYDPDDNHVGLDINGVNSTVAHSLTPFGITISPANADGTNYTVWVDYNGSARHISVYMDYQGKSKPAKPVLNSSLDLSTVIDEVAYIGFSASTGTRFELNCVLAWELMVEKLREEKTGLSKTAIALIVGLSCSISAILALILLAFYIRRKRVRDDPSLLTATALKSLPGMPREFDFKELKKATNNFDEKMKLGQGGFGVVYKGVLPGDNGEEMVVAVKQFSRANTKGQDDFLQELMIINRLRHKHLVRLVGWCHNCGGLLLVYDFMPNGSLDQHLFYPDKPILNWDRRYNIVAGVASALHYLHNEYDQMVVHRDLKASNVMLDSAFHARLGDFGLARALETDKTSYAELSGIQGTMGYIAPECFHTGKATRESDIFAFGATILETVCCRRPRSEIGGFHFLVDWVWKLYREGRILEAVDTRLEDNFDEADADRLLRLGLMCSHPTPCERPKTQAIVQILSRSVPPPDVPPFKPAFVMPAAEPESDSSTLLSTGVTSSYTVSVSDGWTHSSNYASKEHLENDGPVV